MRQDPELDNFQRNSVDNCENCSQLNQLENTDQKLKRMKKYYNRLGKKGETNSGAFENTTLWLEAVVGGKKISAK